MFRFVLPLALALTGQNQPDMRLPRLFNFFSKNMLQPCRPLLYFALHFPLKGKGNLTINRKSFFVWLDNVFVFASRPLTIASSTNRPATSRTPSNAPGLA